MHPRRTSRRPSHRVALAAITAAALLAACGSDGNDVAGPTTTGAGSSVDPPDGTTPTTDPPGDGRGWIDGEPQWHLDYGEGDDSGLDSSASGGKAPMPMSGDTAAEMAPTEAPPGDMGDVGPVEPGQPDTSPLRAGSVDDNADFAAFLEYLARIEALGITTREFDPAGRIVVSVTGTSGLPVAGAEVAVSANGATVATLRTTADGTARFLPALYGQAGVQSFDFTSSGVTATAGPDGTAQLAVEQPGGATAPMAIDILFLLDATGSMGDEIDRLKTTVDSVAARVAAFETKPDLHVAMTLYRDEGDTFVTSTFDFTADIAAFRSALQVVVADGGGDYPEALEEGLAAALSEPAWRDPASTLQLIFLIGDAPPRIDRQVATPYPAAVIDAISRGIKVVPIASSESDDQAEVVFREIAAATGARFVFLSYGAGGAATGDGTDIESTDYEELALDDLVVRLVSEEVTALTGEDPGAPPASTTPPTPPTNPEGQ